MDIHLFTNPRYSKPEDFAGKRVVVIDCLRASSTIITALAHGAASVVPFSSAKDAFAMLSIWPDEEVILGGEQGGRKLAAFHRGNSPRLYTQDMEGKTLFLVTTNGTVALNMVQKAEKILVGALLNGQRVAEEMAADGGEWWILCAGSRGIPALEDTLTAGYMMECLFQAGIPVGEEGLAFQAWQAWRRLSQGLEQLVREGRHGRLLLELGDGEDIPFCMERDRFPLLPQYSGGLIRLV